MIFFDFKIKYFLVKKIFFWGDNLLLGDEVIIVEVIDESIKWFFFMFELKVIILW